MENKTDYELVESIKRSDRTAFFLFLRRYWKPLYLRVLHHTGDEENAFEQVYGLFEAIWDHRHRIPPMESDVTDWFIQIQSERIGQQVLPKYTNAHSRKAFKVELERFSDSWVRPFVLKTNSQK